jgi:hypothetical protein
MVRFKNRTDLGDAVQDILTPTFMPINSSRPVTFISDSTVAQMDLDRDSILAELGCAAGRRFSEEDALRLITEALEKCKGRVYAPTMAIGFLCEWE